MNPETLWYLDADGDGVPDTLENAGRDVLDRDRDGLVTTADADDDDPMQTTSVVPLRNTDVDELPDFLDDDADAEGANDTLEAGGLMAIDSGRFFGFVMGGLYGGVFTATEWWCATRTPPRDDFVDLLVGYVWAGFSAAAMIGGARRTARATWWRRSSGSPSSARSTPSARGCRISAWWTCRTRCAR